MPRPKPATQQLMATGKRLKVAISRSRYASERKGLESLAHATRVSRRTLSNWISGKCFPESNHLSSLAAALSVPARWLRSGNPPMPWEIKGLVDQLNITEQFAHPTAVHAHDTPYSNHTGEIVAPIRIKKPGPNPFVRCRAKILRGSGKEKKIVDASGRTAYALRALFGREADGPFAEMVVGDGRRLPIGHLLYLRRLVRSQATLHHVDLVDPSAASQSITQPAPVLRDIYMVLTGAIADVVYRGAYDVGKDRRSTSAEPLPTCQEIAAIISNYEDRICHALQRHWGMRSVPSLEPKAARGRRLPKKT